MIKGVEVKDLIDEVGRDVEFIIKKGSNNKNIKDMEIEKREINNKYDLKINGSLEAREAT